MAQRSDRARALRRSLGRLVLAAVVVAMLAGGAGWLFSRVDEPRATRLVVGEQVVAEELREDEPGPDPRVPTSGPQRGAPACGVHQRPLTGQQQVATLAAGGVVVQHDPDLAARALARLGALATSHDRVAVAPSDHVEGAVVATAWRHRLEQAEVDADELEAFVTGWRGRGPHTRPCP